MVYDLLTNMEFSERRRTAFGYHGDVRHFVVEQSQGQSLWMVVESGDGWRD